MFALRSRESVSASSRGSLTSTTASSGGRRFFQGTGRASVPTFSCALCPAMKAREVRGTYSTVPIVAWLPVFVKRENLTELLVR